MLFPTHTVAGAVTGGRWILEVSLVTVHTLGGTQHDGRRQPRPPQGATRLAGGDSPEPLTNKHDSPAVRCWAGTQGRCRRRGSARLAQTDGSGGSGWRSLLAQREVGMLRSQPGGPQPLLVVAGIRQPGDDPGRPGPRTATSPRAGTLPGATHPVWPATIRGTPQSGGRLSPNTGVHGVRLKLLVGLLVDPALLLRPGDNPRGGWRCKTPRVLSRPRTRGALVTQASQLLLQLPEGRSLQPRLTRTKAADLLRDFFHHADGSETRVHRCQGDGCRTPAWWNCVARFRVTGGLRRFREQRVLLSYRASGNGWMLVEASDQPVGLATCHVSW
jgi:hypothetical protein